MKITKAWNRAFIFAIIASQLVPADTIASGLQLKRRQAPKSCLETVAEKIDELEQQISADGTVVIKAPDVWGESRLTKHRQEFERVLEKKVDQFQLSLNASLKRSDQIYLANALSIQAALNGVATPPTVSGTNGDLQVVNSLTTGTIAGTPTDPVPIQRTQINQLGNIPGFKFAGTLQDNSGTLAIGLEPTIELDQLKRYLDHLHEIRRINEGDDTADSPGYSLNLIRVPVSILPGVKTRAGCGAEVTITAKPEVSPELLPKVFRDLVINDLVDLLAPAIVKFAERIDDFAYKQDDGKPTGQLEDLWRDANETERLRFLVLGYPFADDKDDISVDDTTGFPRAPAPAAPAPVPPIQYSAKFQNFAMLRGVQIPREPLQPMSTAKIIGRIPVASGNFLGQIRNSRQSVPAIQIKQVFGEQPLTVLGYEFWKSKRNKPYDRQLTDARRFVKDSLDAGYDYLRSPAGIEHWNLVPQIEQAVRSDNSVLLEDYRYNHVQKPYRFTDLTPLKPSAELDKTIPSPVTSCAWWVLVEAALLDQQLNEDIQRVSFDPGCHCSCNTRQAFYLPEPSAEARQAFIGYVNCRWPIHVFALDPVVDQQNVADQYSLRQEMQLALALAFSAGKMNAQNMTRFARRLEIDMETIALNRTVVGFGHGSDTFGWRFTPRVQTPPFESNARVICRNMLWGGPNKDALRRTWELESGPRECVAIVLMPSFIEHVTFHSRGNFFKLADCKTNVIKQDDIRSHVARNVRWSEDMQLLDKLLEQLYCEAERFLPGEIERVKSRVDQLSKRLPLQTVHARVPNGNTLGGFEMFSSGVTDLAPELISYYGAPGIDPSQDTTLFLVGKHFSVHETRIIAGNRNCEFSLLSRDVLRVTVPAGVQTDYVNHPDSTFKDTVVKINLATPYGVTADLEVPVVEPPEPQPTAYIWNRTEIPIVLKFTKSSATPPVFAVADTNIIVKKPHEIHILVPPTRTTAATDEVKFGAYFETDLTGATQVIATATSTFRYVGGEYVLAKTDFQQFLKTITTGIVSLLNSQTLGTTPPDMIDLTISGSMSTGAPIANDLHLLIRLEQVGK